MDSTDGTGWYSVLFYVCSQQGDMGGGGGEARDGTGTLHSNVIRMKVNKEEEERKKRDNQIVLYSTEAKMWLPHIKNNNKKHTITARMHKRITV